MKRLILSVIMTVLLSTVLMAEMPPIEITPVLGYHLAGGTDFEEGRVDIADSMMYGIFLSLVDLPGGISIDLSYTRADSTLEFKSTDTPTYQDASFGTASNYILFGVNKDFLENRFRLFIGADIGAAWFDAKDPSVSDAWFFALDLKGGMKFYLNDRLGFRLQGRFLLPMNFYDSGLFLGIGSGGASGGLTFGGTAVIYQGDFSAGLIIRL
ncbi:MAG: hypothetical protein KAH21_03320 [Spirochaetaceae bacterium]|nr:hypothetical protein [Spirochaetaceae bacterium]